MNPSYLIPISASIILLKYKKRTTLSSGPSLGRTHRIILMAMKNTLPMTDKQHDQDTLVTGFNRLA